jgi:hypothetical protein
MADDTTDPIARLSAADPAQEAPAPDLDAIRSRAREQSQVVPMRSRRTAITVGAVAAGVALLAGTALGGVALGRMTAPDAPVAASGEDSLPVVGGASPSIPVIAGQPPVNTGTPMSAPGGAGTEAAIADKAMIYPGYGVSIIPGDGLPDESTTAPGYRLDSADIDQRALARQLAEAFGVAGDPAKQDYGWTVGGVDGSGPSIWIGDDAMVSWSYSDPTRDPWSCGAVPEPAPAAGSAGAVPGRSEACEPSVAPIGQRDAVRQARKVLASLGVSDKPVDGIDVEWESGGDDYTTWVTAWQRVEGQRTQLAWSFTFAGEDIAWANGFAAGLERIPAYPVVGARTAVLRSADPRFASFGPTPLDGGITVPMAADTSVSSDGAPRAPQGNPRLVQVWWDPMIATGAELSLAQYWQPDGTLLILPAYRVTTADDRGTWALIAVSQSAVDFVKPID